MRPLARPFARVRTTAGFLSLVACFALASPGVEVVRAEPAAAQDGGQCGASQASHAATADAEVEAFLSALRREQARRGATQQSGDVIVLNNRGYNYGPPRRIQHDDVRADARRSDR